jgi:hypothetical protein
VIFLQESVWNAILRNLEKNVKVAVPQTVILQKIIVILLQANASLVLLRNLTQIVKKIVRNFAILLQVIVISNLVIVYNVKKANIQTNVIKTVL